MKPITERFWDLVGVADADSCWEWRGYKTSKGYGDPSNVVEIITSPFLKTKATKINELPLIDPTTNTAVYHDGRIYYIGVAPNPNFDNDPNCTVIIEYDFCSNNYQIYYPNAQSFYWASGDINWKRKRHNTINF